MPCLTLRKITERPVTVEMGTNTIIGEDIDSLKSEVNKIMGENFSKAAHPELWDGDVSQRIVGIIDNWFYAS